AQTSRSFLPAETIPAARVVIVRDAEATEAFQARPERVRAMVENGLTNVTHQGSGGAAWRSLVSTQDFLGLKVYSGPGPTSGTRPAVVAAVIETLLQAGIPTNHLLLWDKSAADLKASGFFELVARYGIAVRSSADAGYDPKTF